MRWRKTSSSVERRTSDDSGWTPRAWTSGERGVAVVGVDEQPVGQHLEPLPDPGHRVDVLLLLVGVEAQLEHLAGRVLGDERAGAALGDDPPVVHDDEPVAQLLGLVHVVGRDDERDALALEPEQPVPQHVPRLRVEAGGRLVEQQHLGVVHEAARDGEPALHPAGQRLDPVVAPLGELGELEQLVGPRAHLVAGEPEEPPVDPEVLLDGEVLVEDVALRADARAGRGSPGRRMPGRARGCVSSPSVTGETQPTMRIVLDLPAPLGPRKPNASPRRTSTSMPSTAVKSRSAWSARGLAAGRRRSPDDPSRGRDSCTLSRGLSRPCRRSSGTSIASQRASQTSRGDMPGVEGLDRRRTAERGHVGGAGERVRVGRAELVLGEGPEPGVAHGRIVCRATDPRCATGILTAMRLITAAEVPASLARVHEPTAPPVRVGLVQHAWDADADRAARDPARRHPHGRRRGRPHRLPPRAHPVALPRRRAARTAAPTPPPSRSRTGRR